AYCMLIPVMLVYYFFRLPLIKNLLSSVLRMTLQLGLVGIYLKYIFHWNNFGINLLWFLFTAAVAGWTVTRQLKLSFKVIFPAVYIALCCGSLAVVLYFVLLVAENSPANAALFVPIGGMVLGNSMRGNVIVIQRFEKALADNVEEYRLRLMLGATQAEALSPFEIDALRSSLTPQLATIATAGIVSLPGMMTGQMLGGADPTTAIEYQAAIMLGIVTSQTLSEVMLLKLLRKKVIKPEVALI
ncbi:MAG: ABC transporter permease, partial [Victivallaceae bacterium]